MLNAIQKIYSQNLKKQKFYFEKEQWESLARQFNLSKKDFLFAALPFAQQFSTSPISHFKVGALLIGESGRLYLGTNVEFPFFPLNQTIHAEQAAISLAYANKEIGIKELYLTAFPCGHCRQFLREIVNYNNLKICVISYPNDEFLLSDILPHSFGSEDLGVNQSLFELHSAPSILILSPFPCDGSPGLQQKLKTAYLSSFAPYSQSPSGCVFVFDDGNTVEGSYLESCAYNPSLSAFHMAYTQVALRRLDPTKIQEIYLLENEKGLVSYEATIRNLVHAILPQAQLYALKVL